MKLERKMVFLNTAFWATLGLRFAIKALPLTGHVSAAVRELASVRLLGVMLGGAGVALWFLRRLDRRADSQRLAVGWMLVHLYSLLGSGAIVKELLDLQARSGKPQLVGLWVAVLVHFVLFFGSCAALFWRKGAAVQRIVKILMAAEATLATLVGFGALAAAGPLSSLLSPGAMISLLGIGLAGVALALMLLGNPAHGDDRRRLLLGLGAGNALAWSVALFDLKVWGSQSRSAWGLLLALVALAAGSLWAGLRPEIARPQPTFRALASRLTWSHLLAGLAAASLVLAAPALSLPAWAALILATLLALVLGIFFAGDLQRILMDPTALVAAGRIAVVPGSDLDEAARHTWLLQVSEAAAQEERNRLARDLHDSIKQQLFSINVGTAAAQERWERDPEGARKALADVRRSAHEAMVEMQAMLHQLRPEALGTAGLIEALREQCEALGYRTGAEVTLELGDPVPDDRLPPGAQQTLFRIAQEALTNVARHARARKIRVRFGIAGEAVGLQVEDDGQGFDPGTGTLGMGLRNLRERTESLGGHLEIASVAGEGTRISIQVPFASAPASSERRLVRVLRDERLAWFVVLPVVAAFLAIPDTLTRVLLVSLALNQEAWSEWQVRSVLRRSPNAAPRDVCRLRYFSLRTRVVMLLGAAAGALQGLLASGRPAWGTLQGILDAGVGGATVPGLLAQGGAAWERAAWTVALCACLALAAVEAVRFYRWSRPFSRPSWVWPSGWERSGGALAFLIGIALALAVPLAMLLRGLRPEQGGLAVLGTLVLLYCLWRRPRLGDRTI